MDIHEFKKEYYKTCSMWGVLGGITGWLVRLLPYSVLPYIVVIFWALINGEITYKIISITISAFIAYMILIIILVIRKSYKIEKWGQGQQKNKQKIQMGNIIPPANKNSIIIMEENFETLLKKHNLLDNSEEIKKEKFDYMIKALYNYSDKIKYRWLTEKAIAGAILLPIWINIVDKAFSAVDISNQDFIKIISLDLSPYFLLLGLWIISYIGFFRILNFISEELVNSNSKQYYDLANKLESYKFGML